MSVSLAEGLRLRGGRYELERRLGAGAAASVWLAQDTLLERRVAVKVLAEGLTEDRAWLARFRREARIAAGLQFPNLVSVYDFDADAERPYLVMEYMPGGSLQDRLEAGGRPDGERLAVDVLRALAHIHAAGITHRDVKPGNVLLGHDGRAALTDFGVARPQDATAITQTGQIPGTARYMAPELWQGQPASARTDLFACGVLLAQCLDDDSSDALVTLTERLSADSPEFRPASAAAAVEMLNPPPPASAPPTVEHEPTPTPTQWPQAEPAASGERRGLPRWAPVAALCLVALVAGFALASALGGDDEGTPTEPTTQAQRDNGNEPAESTPPPADTSADEEPPPTEESTPPADTAPPTSDPIALNDQGFALIQQGQYDEAIPLLEQAVAGLEGSDDITYAYALFNLGNALRLAGRPDEAIPVLEQRLEIPNQKGVVKRELELAQEAASS
jgi:eukaryotic-like serine/threonine-protein kinase